MKKALLLTVLTFCSLISFSQWHNQDYMTIGDAFNFDVGDVFEYDSFNEMGNTTSQSRLTVYGKTVSLNSIVYDVEYKESRRTEYFFPNYYVSNSFYIDSTTLVINGINTTMRDSFPELCIDSIMILNGLDTADMYITYDTNFIFTEASELYYPSNLKVYGTIFDSQLEYAHSTFYVEGLGLASTEILSMGESRGKWLTYYEKSYGSSGNPGFNITGLAESYDKPANLLIYPNPATEFINIRDVSFQKAYAYQIFNLSGQLVQQGMLQSGEEQVNIQNLNSGMYLLHTENRDQPVKIFVQ